MRDFRRLAATVAALKFTALMTTSALAQVAAPQASTETPSSAESSQRDGVIIVTARKRAESVQEVPLAIQVVTGQDIQNQGIGDLRELTKLTPSVTFDRGISPNDFRVAIRGLQAEAGRTSVGVLIDDIDLTSENVGNPGGGFLANPRLLDIERVEVVKGPQSALYGRSAFGGAINYISKRPNLSETEFSGSAEVHSESGFELRAAGGVPIAPGVAALRINGYLWDERGSYRNEISGDYVGGGKGHGIGAGLLIEPRETFSLYGVAQYSDDSFDTPVAVLQRGTTVVDLTDNQTAVLNGNPETVTIFRGQVDRTDIRYDTDENNNDYPGTDSQTTRLALIGDVDLGSVSLKSLSSYTRNKADFLQDNDYTGTLPDEPIVGAVQLSNKQTTTKQFSQELRLQSNTDGPLTWTIGGLYWKENVDLSELNKTALALGPISKADYNAFVAQAFADPRRDFGRDTEHWSGFAFAEFAVTDTFKVSLEGRYVSEKIDYFVSQPDYVFFNTITATDVPGEPIIGVLAAIDTVDSASIKEEYFIPRGAISFQPSEDVNIYASIGTGVKPGGYQTSGVQLFDDTVIYDRENLTAYEVGVKSTLFDRMLTFNVAAFYQDYSDQQVRSQVFNEELQQLQGVTENAGKTRIWGFEIESALRPAEGLTLTANYTYLNAEFTEFTVLSNSASRVAELPDCTVITTPSGALTCELDRSGLTPPDLPTHRVVIRSEYVTPISDTTDLFIDGIFSHKSKTFADTSNQLIQPARSVVDASIGIQTGPVRAAVFVENLFDDRKITDSNLYIDFSAGFAPAAFGYLADPRKVGFRVSADF